LGGQADETAVDVWKHFLHHLLCSGVGLLEYLIKDYGWKELAVVPHTLLVEDYAIVLPTGSELREPMNRALLQALYSPAWKTALQR
jgi:ABC-type amino acid transport substrate-binding protein